MQGIGAPYSVSDFGPSQKPGSAQYTINQELADDINLVGTISRVDVRGYSPGPVPTNPSSAHFYGLSVKFYAFGADNKPGALQAEYFISKDSPNFILQNSRLSDLYVRLEPAFQANGRHFMSVQVVMDPVALPGNGGATSEWYWRSDNLEACPRTRILLPGNAEQSVGTHRRKSRHEKSFDANLGNANSGKRADHFADFNQ